jgi:hypothetical protein
MTTHPSRTRHVQEMRDKKGKKEGDTRTLLHRIPIATAYLSIAILLSVTIIFRSIFLTTAQQRDLDLLPTIMKNATTAAETKTFFHICFISSQFASSNNGTDKLFNVANTVPNMRNSPYYHFFAFSNLPDLKAEGWQPIVKDLRQYNRFITQSRWPKFQAFREPQIRETCEVVFYIDGIISPYDIPDHFQKEAKRIMNSSVQFAQRLHPVGGGAEDEFKRIKKQKKDVKTNIKASLQWLRAQSDYDKNCTLYENNMFGYSMQSKSFQQAADFFWDHYSKELDSWRGKFLFALMKGQSGQNLNISLLSHLPFL